MPKTNMRRPVVKRYARGGVTVNPKHNIRTWNIFQSQGWDAVYDALLAGLDLRNRRVVVWWPHTAYGHEAFFRHIGKDYGLDRLADRVHAAGGVCGLYIRRPSTGDVYPLSDPDQQRELINKKLAYLPARSEVWIDELQGLDSYFPLGAECVDNFIASGRSVVGEPHWWTYAPHYYNVPCVVNADKYGEWSRLQEWRKHGRGVPTCFVNFNLPIKWSVQGDLIEFASEVEQRPGEDWLVPAELLLPNGINIDSIDPRKN